MKKSKKPAPHRRPKGSYPLPNGNYVVRQGRITAIHKDPPALEKLARAPILLAEDLARSKPERS
jgi:hypothetical protein